MPLAKVTKDCGRSRNPLKGVGAPEDLVKEEKTKISSFGVLDHAEDPLKFDRVIALTLGHPIFSADR
jgi:hypothetical protein